MSGLPPGIRTEFLGGKVRPSKKSLQRHLNRCFKMHYSFCFFFRSWPPFGGPILGPLDGCPTCPLGDLKILEQKSSKLCRFGRVWDSFFEAKELQFWSKRAPFWSKKTPKKRSKTTKNDRNINFPKEEKWYRCETLNDRPSSSFWSLFEPKMRQKSNFLDPKMGPFRPKKGSKIRFFFTFIFHKMINLRSIQTFPRDTKRGVLEIVSTTPPVDTKFSFPFPKSENTSKRSW